MTTLRQRKSPRLQGYDYSQAGAYFVTICTHHRLHLFGSIHNSEMTSNVNGKIAADCWQSIPSHYPDIDLDAFIIMPNHVHGILIIQSENTVFKTVLGRVINAYKGAVTANIRKETASNTKVWQSRYHDHIIRNENSLNYIRNYIIHNPASWEKDTLYI